MDSSTRAGLIARIGDRPDPDVQTERRRGVGASQVAAVLGLGKWTSEFELYLLKRREIEDTFEGNELTEWGLRMEDVIIPKRAEVAISQGLTVVRPKRIYYSLRFPDMFCSPDAFEFEIGRHDVTPSFLDAPPPMRFVDDAKNMDYWMEREWDETGVPMQYMLQLQQSAYVFGAEAVALDVLFGGNRYRRFEFEADPELGEMLGQVCTQFMDRVREGRPPAPQHAHSGTAQALARRFRGREGEKHTLSPKAVQALLELQALGEQASWVENRQEELRNLIRDEMRDAVEGIDPYTGKTVVSWTAAGERTAFTMKDFREAYPHLYRLVDKKLAKPSVRSSRINLRPKALEATREAWAASKENP